ncbi:hypothetical protein PCANC_17567 [Puccinia coronata f. sp. avenae]|uniref:Uncharacterized protein n=1 Tax=Puccinia coronata f. sp. avenae TaxID=200324 RepID=A0A2N5S076_9BASI|nr:hypothetical protein PCASD_20044 [Puccinia coronata f. sp. avenae]PLW30798.1 hypothetical protein PCASD_13392 [Puccinia coronata f. sp. avenae]PLW31447.1 hypothetical protein PCANC_17567 [Puccinia coronata f. sp. avenae]
MIELKTILTLLSRRVLRLTILIATWFFCRQTYVDISPFNIRDEYTLSTILGCLCKKRSSLSGLRCTTSYLISKAIHNTHF